jgi:putative SOS response-associated peptidase YedK
MCARYRLVVDASRLKQFCTIKGLAGRRGEVRSFRARRHPFIRAGPAGDAQRGKQAEPVIGPFGLPPHWTKDSKLAKSTYNANPCRFSEALARV